MKGIIILDEQKQKKCKKCKQYTLLENFKKPFINTCKNCRKRSLLKTI